MPTYQTLLLCERDNDTQPRVLRKYGDRDGFAFVDKSGQGEIDLNELPLVLCEVTVSRKNLSDNIRADPLFWIVATRDFNDADDVVASTMDTDLTASDITAFGAWVDARFSNLRAGRRNRIKSLLTAGTKRVQAMRKLQRKLRSNADVDSDDPVPPPPSIDFLLGD